MRARLQPLVVGGIVSVPRRTATTNGFKPPDDVDTADGIATTPDGEDSEVEPLADDDTETSFTSLEQHMFGEKYFERGAESEPDDLTTMLHRRPSDADTVLQRSSTAPPPVQVVTVLPAGARPTDTPPPSAEGRLRPQTNLIAAGGVFAGMSFVAAGSLVALGLVAAVAIWFLLRGPAVEPLPPIGTPVPAAPVAPGAPPPAPIAVPAVPSELVEGVRFPATFAFDDWRVQDLDGDALDALVHALESCPGTIRVVGHTDGRGEESVNDRMAVVRASEVRRILEAHAIDRARIEVGSAGSGLPTAEEDTPEGRAMNRRVTVRCD